MKELTRVWAWVGLAVLMILSGCALQTGVRYTDDGLVQIATTVNTPVVDGVAVTTTSTCVVKNPVADPSKRRVISNPEECKHHSVQQFASDPTAAAVVKGAVPIAVGQVIVGEYGKKVAEIGKCAPGAVCDGNVVNVMSQANSLSQQQTTVDSKVSVNGLPCGTPAQCAQMAR